MTASNSAHGTAYDTSDWREQAACLNEDPELFFPVGTSREAREQAEKAKAVCRSCDVSDDCLALALNNGEQYGVWAGQTEDERAGVKRKRTTNRLTARDVEQIVALAAEGYTDRRISDAIGVHRSTVSTVLRSRGRPDMRGGPRSMTPDLVEVAQRLIGEGLSQRDVARRLGTSQASVRRAVTSERVAS